MMFPKPKVVRLHGKEKAKLREQIFERDNYRCVICGGIATDWHHQPFGANKSDEITKGVALCHFHHMQLHFDYKVSQKFKCIVEGYLKRKYPFRREN